MSQRWQTFFVLFIFFCVSPQSAKAEIRNQSITASETSTTLTRLPYYENSADGEVVISQDGTRLTHFDDTGIANYDLTDPNAVWQLFFNFDDYEGTYDSGVGSLAQDPAGDDVYYFCMGTGLGNIDDNQVDYQIALDLAALYRTTDGFTSASRISGNDFTSIPSLPYHTDYDTNKLLERYVLGCFGRESGRYIYDQTTGTELWWTESRNAHRFAFDTSTTVTDASSQTMSENYYFATGLQGLFKCTYNADASAQTCENIGFAPRYHSSDTGTTTTDFRYYVYEPQTNDGATSDKRSTYAPVAGSCDTTFSGVAVTGELDSTSTYCIEDEIYYVATAVAVDPFSIDRDLNDATQPVQLAFGAMVNDLWKHGGLFFGEESGGTATWTEYKHPDDAALPVSDQRSLDVRDMVFLGSPPDGVTAVETPYIQITATGESVAKHAYIASGGNGMMKMTRASDGSITITPINDGLYTRDDLHDDFASGATRGDAYLCPGLTTCGFFTNIDYAYKSDGTVALLAIEEGGGIFYAIDDFVNPIQWYRIWELTTGSTSYSFSTRDGALSDSEAEEWANNGNFGVPQEGATIDPATGDLIIPNNFMYRVDSIDITRPGEYTAGSETYHFASAAFHSFSEGYGDYGGIGIYNPYKATINNANSDVQIYLARLDGGMDFFSYDENYQLDTAHTGYSIEDGYCLSTYSVSGTSGFSSFDTNSDDTVDFALTSSSYPDTRKAAYGLFITSVPKNGTESDYVFYLGANDSNDAANGVIYRGEYSATTGHVTWSLATGDKSCVTKYPYGNASRNSCINLCDAEDSAATMLPLGSPVQMAVDPNDSDHVITVLYRKSTLGYELWESHDGGSSWTDISSKYADDTGASLSTLGSVEAVQIDPRVSDIFYILFRTANRIYMKDTGVDHFVDITEMHTDDNITSSTLSAANAAETLPGIKDIQFYSEDGKTVGLAAVNVFCDASYGSYPTTPCGTMDGGGVYKRVIGVDSDWTKLNTSSDVEFMSVNNIAVSPVNHNNIVAVGIHYDIDWMGGGYMQDAIAGIIYSKDGGATWHRLTNTPISARYVNAHPTDENKFLISMEAAGVWELDLNNPDTDGDGVHDDFDSDPLGLGTDDGTNLPAISNSEDSPSSNTDADENADDDSSTSTVSPVDDDTNSNGGTSFSSFALQGFGCALNTTQTNSTEWPFVLMAMIPLPLILIRRRKVQLLQ